MRGENFDTLSDLQIDVLREIGNIGAGNAATALSTMLSQRVDMGVPKVRIIDIKEIAAVLGGPENLVVGILVTIHKDVEGMMMFILEKQFAHLIINLLMGRDLTNFDSFEEMDLSALKEIGNIMVSSYVNAIASLTSQEIDISVPDIAIDMAGAILSVPAIEFGSIGDRVLLIEEEFSGGSDHVASYLMLIPKVDSLHKILEILGVKYE
ncbi:chemotaxis protein CheC [Candidatus Formimonas warabiya]|uniref:CheY-P-specific phosphatase CheC n=1 Tax=Formimonas warabiya TaxID=1761012 RepID=A0A3G1KPE3_FORW1|nr:chemotaxis protein CheC [Candidatus Formimonas warabiya]ATW24306.1 CheY-P-specific phosphatase CheC [Candidatus Formimonas warabiya]